MQYMLFNKRETHTEETDIAQHDNTHNTNLTINNSFRSNTNIYNYNNLMLDTLLLQSESFSIDNNQLKLNTDNRMLSFCIKNPNKSFTLKNVKNMFDTNKLSAVKEGQICNIAQTPERILDAPNLIDDYYLNLLDWSCSNELAISLGNTVYLWNGNTCESTALMSASANICSVSWMNSGTCLALGMLDGSVELWDTNKSSMIRSMPGHTDRVSSLAWNNYVISSGSRDSKILNHDVRIREHVQNRLIGHNQEVCALKWSPDGSLLASGGNDNLLCIWDINYARRGSNLWDIIEEDDRQVDINPMYTFTNHEAAVKAIAWCPWQKGLLASGGGTKDKSIKFWNIDTGSLINSIDVGSQVCSLLWDKYEKELISSHGYSKHNICVWKYPNMCKLTELNGHMSRVLYLAMSPDGNTIVSGAGDETLRFWRIHDGKRKDNNFQDFDYNYKSSSSKILNSFQIR
jgi:cell division cycle protein 20 (cofactor of APC complex)